MAWRNWFTLHPRSAKSVSTRPVTTSSIPAYVLEPRILFDGAIAATVNDTAAETAEPTASHADAAADQNTHDTQATATQDIDVAAVADGATSPRKEVAFVDTSVKDYETLVAGIKPGVEVVLIDGSQNGLQQIADWAASHSGYDAIHIFSHGSEGKVNLGTQVLTDASLKSGEVQAQLAALGAALTAEGDLLLYGCDIAGGANGDAFLSSLAQATGADVAASVDATGSSLIGGDWILEKTTGGIDTDVMAIEAYSDVLGTVTFFDNDIDLDATRTTITRPVEGQSVTFSGGIGTGGLYVDPSYGGAQNGGLYAYDGTKNGDNTELTIKPPSGYTFDITGIRAGATSGILTFTVTDSNGNISSFNVAVTDSFSTITSFPSAMNDVTQVVISSDGYSAFQDIVISDIKLNVPSPAITSAAYNASTNVLTVTGANLATGDTIDVSRLTLVGENGNAYTLTSSNVIASSSTTFTINLNTFDQLNVEGLLNKNGTTSAASGTTFNLAAAAGWNATQSSTPADLTGNGVTVSNVQTPTITSSTYDNSTGTLTVTGTNLVKQVGANNDINVSTLTFTGQGGSTYTLTSSSVEIGSATSFTVMLNATDRAALGAILNNNGTSSSGGTTYNLAAADDWNGPITGGNTADLTGNGITVSGVNAAPVIGNFNNDSVNYTEGAQPVLLDAGGNATVSDADSADFNGGSLWVSITANRNVGEDVSGILNQGIGIGQIGVIGSAITWGGVVIGTFSGGSGANDLVVTFNANATPAAVQGLIRALTYQNTNTTEPSTATRTVTVTLNDGDGGSTSAMVAVGVTGVNDAPTLSATGTNPTYTENGSAVDLFSNVSVGTVEAGQTITRFTLTVSNLANASSEQLQIDGTTIALINGNSGTTTTNGLSYSVSIVAGTATMTLNKSGGISSSAAVTVIDGMTYRNTSENPTGPVRTVTVTSITDSGGTANGGVDTTVLSVSSTVSVVAVNDAPTISVPVSISVTEDVARAITGITFSDVDAGSNNVTVTLSVTSGMLSLNGSQSSSLTMSGTIAALNTAIANGSVMFHPASNATGSVTLTISINDEGNTGSGGAKTASTAITLNIDAVNDAPVNSVPTGQTVQQDGSLVFSAANGNPISVSDVDLGGNTMRMTLTATHGLLTLSSSTGLVFLVGTGAGNGTMTFEGTLSDINNALNGLTFNPNSGYNGGAAIQMTSNDLGGTGSGGAQTDIDVITITVNPNNPTITGVSATTADGAYGPGQTILVTVSFDASVLVDTTGGIPNLLLETGTIDRVATYVAGSGTNTLTFAYTVQSGDRSADLNYVSTSALSLNGATITDNANRTAVLTLPGLNSLNSLAAQKAIVIDGVAASALVTVGDNALKAGESTQVTITFSEPVTGFSLANLSVADGTLTNLSSSDGGLTWTATLTPNASVTNASSAVILNYTGITDAVGNANIGTQTSGTISIDTTLPEATIEVSDSALKAGETAQVTITFSEPVAGFSSANLTVTGGVLSNLSSTDGGITWTATFTPNAGVTSASTTIGLDYSGITDLAGNVGVGTTASDSFSIDTAHPLPVSLTLTGIPATEALSYTLVFSEAVTGLDIGDFSLVNGSGTTATIGALVALSPTTYRIDLTNVTGAGTVQLVFTGNNGGVKDLAGNDLNGQGIGGDTHSNSAPVANGIANQSASQGSAFTFTLPGGAFVDNDPGETLTYGVSLADGSALPSWLVFNPQTQTFSGTPENGDVGTLTIRVTATDKNSVPVSSDFTLVVNNVNDAPVTAGISDHTVSGDGAFSFVIPANTFSDIDVGDTLQLSATLADGSALPAWVSFDPATGTFSGTPAGTDGAAVSILVTATDAAGASVSATFVLRVLPATPLPEPEPQPQQPTGDPEFKANGGRSTVALPAHNAAVQSQLSLLTLGASADNGASSSFFNAGRAEGTTPGIASVFNPAAQGSASAIATVFASDGVTHYDVGVTRSHIADISQPVGGKSTLAGMFASAPLPGSTALEVFSNGSWQSVSQSNTTSLTSPVSVFGAPVFSQQLKALDDNERLQIASLEGALQNMNRPV
ncbi:putative Ig domain-containing protein [Enterobacter sp. BIGb0383]|uniref:Ig-like domain-containing protein n=1 Tax=unclassified Enterobacter TaxID=2608935 RepID=UPI000F97B9B8|nr:MULTISPECIES: Ig-like domain-containing protein [unclassified Enterobacter]ROP58365.1 putative Ig domain-containing protein [Enterobacter sp. BIGb0383]ROS06747.1 putative Ig domain-containing protein [Enterobacter sp. BIGb0359]